MITLIRRAIFVTRGHVLGILLASDDFELYDPAEVPI